MVRFINGVVCKFRYGEHVVNHLGKDGIIEGIRIYQSIHFREDAYMVSYFVDPSPGMESDDEFWESEVNLKLKN